MSKAHRGKGILDQPAHGRGTCPITKQTGVKLLYQTEVDGQTISISKMARATLANSKQKVDAVAKAKAHVVQEAEAAKAKAAEDKAAAEASAKEAEEKAAAAKAEAETPAADEQTAATATESTP